MVKFKKYFEERAILGLIEFFDIEGIGIVPAKLDSGNGAYNVLHGEDLQEQGSKVFFRTVNGKTLLKDKTDEVTINVGAGNIEHRPVVEFNVKVGDKLFSNVPFSIGNRSTNIYKILVGKQFIEKDLDALIDVSAENIAGDNLEVDA
mgnify:FL=1|tara:strand:- start:659 stop:1099 length:441 start_codon:yes stop_codon:yes gene_type:complete